MLGIHMKKYQFLINKREGARLKHCRDSKAFAEYSNYMDDTYENIEEYNPIKESKTWIIFDDIIADMLINKKRNLIATELFIRDGNLHISLVFITKKY